MRPRVAGLIVAAVLAAAGCGGGGKPTAAPTSTAAPTTSHDMSAMAGMTATEHAAMSDHTTADHTSDMAPTQASVDAGLGDCPQHMPGELLTADEAVVRFDTQMVCLGYVTVTPGTPIAWTNGDTTDRTVTILDDEDRELNEFTVRAGASVTTPAAATGVYRFQVSAIESFTGTIEVQ